MIIPNIWKNNKLMFQTTNQIVYGMLIVFIIPILVEIIDEDLIPKERKG